MKKTAIALAVSGLAFASVANAAPEANSVYVGAKAGWASFHDGLTQWDAKYNNGEGFGINKNSVTYGIFAGYQIIDNLAVEAGYDYYGRVRGTTKFEGETKDKHAFKHTAHGANIALKGNYEVIRGLDTYAKVGLALVRNDYYIQDTVVKADRIKDHRFQTSLLLGAGVEYAITPSLAARVEYQWLNNAGKAGYDIVGNGDYRPDISSVSAGLTYRFGQGFAPAIIEPEIVTKNFAFSSDVLFDFNKSSLKPEAATALNAAQAEINNLGLADAAIQVNGYTDRLGKDAYNLKLSQRRAETVANYMVSQGTNPAAITAVGYGKANPVTGNTCDAVKGRKALIACLAPDRRVEVQVQGSKQVTM